MRFSRRFVLVSRASGMRYAARRTSSASERYDKASARCRRPTRSVASRSASVRATRNTRWYPRAVRRIESAASRSSANSSRVCPRHFLKHRSTHLRIRAHVAQTQRRISFNLNVACARHTCSDFATPFAGRGQNQVRRRHRRDLDMQIDPVEQRTGQPALIVRGAIRVLTAFADESGIAGASAAARIHRCHQHESCRIGNAMIGT